MNEQSQQKYNVAILGATGNVGRLLLDIMEERNFPYGKLKLLASERSVGQTITSSSGKEFTVELAESSAFEGIDIVFASAGGSISKKFAPDIVKAGGVIVDNSSAFRMDEEVPLVVPEVNADDIKKHKGIIANPNCSTAPLVLALEPLKKFGLKRIVVSTYQSVSGAGKEAMDELAQGSKATLDTQAFEYKSYSKPMAFNLIPQIDVFMDNDYTKEEMKLINESRKMLHLPDLKITCTAVRVPVFISHSESINLEFEQDVSIDEIKSVWSDIDMIKIQDDPATMQFPTPLEVTGKDPVYIGRIRKDESQPNTINFWLVSDNLRIGAALNTVKIGESLVALKTAASS